MLNLIDNWKCYILLSVIIFLASLNLVQWFQNSRISHKLEVCQNNQLAVEIGSQYRKKQEVIIEQEAAQSQAESVKRAAKTMHAESGKTCEENIAWMIANKPV